MSAPFTSQLLSLILYLGGGSRLWAAGFEKTIPWSGKHAGTAGTAVSFVHGAEALYFNPAGLARSGKLSSTLNLSPTSVKFSGPVPTSYGSNGIPLAAQVDSTGNFFLTGSAMLSTNITPSLGVGIGYYAAGGTRANFPIQTFAYPGYPALNGRLKNQLSITELSVGAGYELVEGLRVGLAYRVIFTGGSLASLLVLPNGMAPTLAAADIENMSGTQWNGIRAGVQYAPLDQRFGLGLQYRSQVAFTANGNGSAVLAAPLAQTTTLVQNVPVGFSATLPYQLSGGGYYEIMPKLWRAMFEYSFTNYHVDQGYGLRGMLLNRPIPGVVVNGSNLSVYRLGTDYQLQPEWTLRAGYAYTTQSTPAGAANVLYPTPGAASTVTLGAGYQISPSIDLNAGIEYSWVSANVTSQDLHGVPGTIAGTFSNTAYAAHLGLTYHLD